MCVNEQTEYCHHCGQVRAIYVKRFPGYTSFRCANCDKEIDCEFYDDDDLPAAERSVSE